MEPVSHALADALNGPTETEYHGKKRTAIKVTAAPPTTIQWDRFRCETSIPTLLPERPKDVGMPKTRSRCIEGTSGKRSASMRRRSSKLAALLHGPPS